MFKPMSAKTYTSLTEATSEGVALVVFMFLWFINISLRVVVGALSVRYVAEHIGPFLVHHEVHANIVLCGIVGLFTVRYFFPMAAILWLIIHLS